MPTELLSNATPELESESVDRQAQLDSVFWFRELRATGALEEYEGMYVAIEGHEILDADGDERQLIQHIEASVDAASKQRIVIQYVPRPGEWALR